MGRRMTSRCQRIKPADVGCPCSVGAKAGREGSRASFGRRASCSQESPQPCQQPRGLPRFALPHNQHSPAETPQFAADASITGGVGLEFRSPEISARCRSGASPRAAVTMPEATMNEYGLGLRCEDEIRLPWQRSDVQPVAIASGKDHAPNNQFWRCIAAANTAH